MSRTRRPVLRACLSIALGALTLLPVAAAPAGAATGVAKDDAATSTPAEEDVDLDVLANDVGVGADDWLDVSGTSTKGADVWADGRVIHYRGHVVGNDTFSYSVMDGNDGSVRGTATVTVPVTKALVVSARDDDYEVEKDLATSLPVTENDTADQAPLHLNLRSDPDHGTLAVVPDDYAPQVSYTPEPGYAGDDSFVYQLVDADGVVDSGTVTVHVKQISVRDLSTTSTWDGAVLRWRQPRSAQLRGIAVRLSDGVPGGGASAPDTVTDGTDVPVTDGATHAVLSGLTRGSEYAVSVFAHYADGSWSEPSQQWFTPGIEPVQGLTADGGNATARLAWVNPTGGDLTRVTYSTPTGATKRVDVVAGGATTTISGLVNGHAYDFSVQARGDGAWSDAEEVSATPVSRVDRAPTAVDDIVSLHGDDPINFYVVGNDTDPDAADSLGTVPIAANAFTTHHGSLSCDNGGSCTYAPDSTTSPGEDFDYTVTDGHGGRDQGQVQLVRRDVTGLDDEFTTGSTTGRTLDVLANDTGAMYPNDTVTVDTGSTSVGHFDAGYTDDGSRPAVSFEPNGTLGTADVVYRVRDEFGNEIAHATVSVEVQLAPTVSATADHPVAPVGSAVTISGRAKPVDTGASVNLERLSNGTWQQVQSTTFATGSTPSTGAPYAFTLTEAQTGYPAYRVVVPAAGGRAETVTDVAPLTIVTASLPSVRRTGNEYVTLKNTGHSEFAFTHWTITTKAGKKLTLPRGLLLTGKSVRIHPGSGTSTRTDVYLRRGASFGNTHDRLRLRTQYGSLVATKTY